MPPRHVAVIDIGKTNAKVALVDLTTLSQTAVRRTPNCVLPGGNSYPHHDEARLWTFILESLTSLNAEQAVDAVSVTAHGATAALVGADGNLAMPILDYEHPGPEEASEAFAAVRPDFSESGSPRLPAGLNLASQLFWLQERFPAEFAETAMILTYPQYWSYRLTGIAATEVTSLGCHTDLWNPVKRRYSSLVDRMGWQKLLAPLRPATEFLGPILPAVAKTAGLSADCPVVCGIHDSNASLLPHLLSEQQPFSVVSTGTWVVVMAVGRTHTDLDPRRDTLINVDAFGDPVRSARFMGGREYARILADRSGDYTEDDLASVLRKKAMVLPSIERGSGPFANRKGGWSVAPDELSPGERAAGAACYLALMTVTCLDMIGAQGPILVEGAFGRDPLLMQLIATLTGRPVRHANARTTGTSVGAAMLLHPVPANLSMQSFQPDTLADLRGGIHSYAHEWLETVRREDGQTD